MRKSLVLIMIAFLCLPIFQFAHLVSSSSQSSTQTLDVGNSVVENGGFEEGLTGWSIVANGFLAVSSENVHSGNSSLEIVSSISEQAGFYQYIDCPNASFVFSFWIFRVDPSSETHCYLNREWDGNTARVVSSLVIKDDTIGLQAWDEPYAVGRQTFNYTVTIGVWHNVTFAANATLGIQDFYIDGNLIQTLNSSSGTVFGPDDLIFGDVSNEACKGTFYFDDIALNALETANTSNPTPDLRVQPENMTVKRGETFTISVVLENIPENPGTAGIQFTVNWNQTVLSALNMTEVLFHEVTPPSEWDNIWELGNVVNNTEGYVTYAYLWYDSNRATVGGYAPVWGNHTLATITLMAIETGSTTLHFSDMIVGTPDAEVLICSSDLPNTPLLSSLITDGSVDVKASVKAAVADVNGDGSVDLFDALLMAQHFGSKEGELDWDPSVDLNGDAQVDIYDFIILAHSYGKHA